MPLPRDRHLSLNIKVLAVYGGKRGRLVYDTFVVLILSAYKNGEWLDVGYWILDTGCWSNISTLAGILENRYWSFVIG